MINVILQTIHLLFIVVYIGLQLILQDLESVERLELLHSYFPLGLQFAALIFQRIQNLDQILFMLLPSLVARFQILFELFQVALDIVLQPTKIPERNFGLNLWLILIWPGSCI